MEEKTLPLELPVFVLEDAVLLPGAVARLDTDPKKPWRPWRLGGFDGRF